MRRFVLPLTALLLIAIGLTGIAALWWWDAADLGRPTDPSIARRGPGGMMGRNVDAMFIEQMVPHHDDAIAMAKLALTRAEHPELRELAQDIERTQTAENDRMRGWYRDWFGTDVPDYGDGLGMGGPMMRGGVDLSALENAGDFDKAFIEQMIPHHRMAIMMSRMAGSSTRRDEMRQLTNSIIETQSDEIERMRAWYAEWYGD